MKKNLAITLVAIFIGCATNKLYSQSIKFVLTDGTTSSYSLASSSIITFADDNLLYNTSEFTSTIESIRKITFDTSSGIDNISSDSGIFSVYPNPASDYLKFSLEIDQECQVHVYSISGQLLLSKSIRPASETVDVSALQSGAYIVRIKNQTAKFIKL